MDTKGIKMENSDEVLIEKINSLKAMRCLELFRDNKISVKEIAYMSDSITEINNLIKKKEKLHKRAKRNYWWLGNPIQTNGGLTRFAISLLGSVGIAMGIVFGLSVTWPLSFAVLAGGVVFAGLVSRSVRKGVEKAAYRYRDKIFDISTQISGEEVRLCHALNRILEKHDPEFLRKVTGMTDQSFQEKTEAAYIFEENMPEYHGVNQNQTQESDEMEK